MRKQMRAIIAEMEIITTTIPKDNEPIPQLDKIKKKLKQRYIYSTHRM